MHADGWKLSRTGKFIADFGSDANAENEKLRTELQKQSRDDLFQFLSLIIQAEISLDLSNATDQFETLIPLLDTELTSTNTVVQVAKLSQSNRLGNMRLVSIELLEKAMHFFGIKMLKVYEDAELYSTLIKFFGIFPFNDIALKTVSNILAHALDQEEAIN